MPTMKPAPDDLDTARGIVVACLVSVAFWAAVVALWCAQ
jgi:hypothetical protein